MGQHSTSLHFANPRFTICGRRGTASISSGLSTARKYLDLGEQAASNQSIINGYDVPKIYFHEYTQPIKRNGELVRYAIVDGKQRLTTIWSFMDNQFALADDFKYFRDGTDVDAASLKDDDLARKYPRIKSRFDATSLDVITIQTDDIDLIDDMFSRLNEAVPLNAAEGRNAYAGPMPKAIREVAKHTFFTKRLPFVNSRYKHYDLAAKFLYLESSGTIVDTKKAYLDAFVLDYANSPNFAASDLEGKVKAVLDKMGGIFGGQRQASSGDRINHDLLFTCATRDD